MVCGGLRRTANPPPDRPVSLGRLQLAGRHLAAALVALELEADLLAFRQRAEARTFDGGDVDEHVLAAAIRLDEAKALGGVEPLHGSNRHSRHLSGVRFRAPI